ncbi:MAG: hypothetical protein AAGG68_03130 [Bacteroidota bacterium]
MNRFRRYQAWNRHNLTEPLGYRPEINRGDDTLLERLNLVGDLDNHVLGRAFNIFFYLSILVLIARLAGAKIDRNLSIGVYVITALLFVWVIWAVISIFRGFSSPPKLSKDEREAIESYEPAI